MFRDTTNLKAFIDRFGFGVGHVFFMTVTFKKNKDKVACADAFNVFRTFLNSARIRFQHGISDSAFHYISVWEEHKKGGWHLHILGSIQGVTTNKIRSLIRHFLSVTSTVVGFIHVIWTKGRDGNGIKNYMTKYLSKEHRKKGVRYVNYSRNWPRVCCLPFSWVGGMGFLWRKACRELSLNFPNSFSYLYHNCSYRLRQSLISAWIDGDILTAVSFLKRYGWEHITSMFEFDLQRFIEFGLANGSVMSSENDYAVCDFLTFSSDGKEFEYSIGRPLEDSDFIDQVG